MPMQIFFTFFYFFFGGSENCFIFVPYNNKNNNIMTTTETIFSIWLIYSLIAICVAVFLVNIESKCKLSEKKCMCIFYTSTFLVVSVPLSLFIALEIL